MVGTGGIPFFMRHERRLHPIIVFSCVFSGVLFGFVLMDRLTGKFFVPWGFNPCHFFWNPGSTSATWTLETDI